MRLKKYSKIYNSIGRRPNILKKIKKTLISFLVALTIFIGVPNSNEITTIFLKDNPENYTLDEDGAMYPINLNFDNPMDNSDDILQGGNYIRNNQKNYTLDEDGAMYPINLNLDNPINNSNDILQGGNIIKNNQNK